MSEELELRLEIQPGIVKVKGLRGSGPAPVVQGGYEMAAVAQEAAPSVLTLEVSPWPAARKQAVLLELAARPGELYELLQGQLSARLAGLGLLPDGAELASAVYELGSGAAERAELQKLLKQRLAEEPLLALSLRGLDKEELLAGVFGLWAGPGTAEEEEAKPDASGALAAELARLERKGPAVSSGEWLAEAAAEGSLHQPGPLFHEIAARPFPVSPVVAEPAEDWASLLPRTPNAAEGLALIMREVAAAAARRAAGLKKM
ncbi:hypothetical protein [Paenibacillus riograndensis]|uniref:Uncharacterized protein n=1 Tax=Paenibacillus riograndensis SBR5 TaxID=1073571 RepID=A0A0E4CUG5_9BACL|nr:hypothetical protein [Paenibacillus riograndensis]CQR52081.1 hypothetical protein PRIO_0633 [Paenibacillus riograndensis SBR5]